MKLYTCNACRYTFPAETLPDRCPDCGKATANVKVCIGGKNILRSVPAIRESTDTEVAEYERIINFAAIGPSARRFKASVTEF